MHRTFLVNLLDTNDIVRALNRYIKRWPEEVQTDGKHNVCIVAGMRFEWVTE